jgi:hypothetical protein
VTVEAVWYGCYGSNLDATRFRCYLEGGTPPGATRSQPGCRDRTPPTGDRPVQLHGQVHFTCHATGWGGAVAFLDTGAPGTSPGRAYRLTTAQLEDVVAQENGRPPGSVAVDVSAVVAAGRVVACPGWYGTVAHVGAVDGEPLLTITSSWSVGDVEPAPPSGPYLRTIGVGLAASHGWPRARVAAHLASLPGVAGTWDPASVAEALEGRYSTPRR